MTEVLDRVSVSKLVPKDNVRSTYPKHSLNELAASIAAEGQLQAIGVKPVAAGKFEVEFGYRRYNAIMMIAEDPAKFGLDAAPNVKITYDSDAAFTDAETLVRQVVENIQREDLSVMDEAKAYASLIGGGMSQADIARKVGKNRSHVSKRLSLLELPAKVQRMVDDKTVSIELGVEMAKLADPVTDLAWVFDQLEDGFAPEIEEVAEAVKVALAAQQAQQAKAEFASALAAAGHTVLVSSQDALPRLEALKLDGEHTVTMGTEFSPSKVPAKEPKNALGVQVLSPTSARFLIATPKGEASPESVAVSAADRRAAREGDTVALEKLAAKERAEKQQRRNTMAAVRIERAHRQGFLSTVAFRAKAADVAQLALQYIVKLEITDTNIQRVCEILGLDPEVKEEPLFEWKGGKNQPTGKVRNIKVWRNVLKAFVAESDKNLRAAATAAMITRGESALAERSPGFELSHFAPEWGYPQFLMPFDFQPVPPEELLPAAPEEPEPKATKAVAGGTKKAPAKKAAASKKAPAKPTQQALKIA